MVGDVVNGAPEWDFPDWPRGIVGQIGGQDADPQLALWKTHRHTHTHTLKPVQGKIKLDVKQNAEGLHESNLI